MDTVHITELNPELPARDSKQFKAAVTLIWPYSSSQRQFALLLAEPDLRLRRNKGQVRARFSSSSAKALATTGIGIGDEVVLSLKGAQFVQEGTVSTPGRSIDWELDYTDTVVVWVFRNGSEIANLDLLDVVPTPALRSPTRREAIATTNPAQQWSSPAFLKRARLSDGPFFEAPYNPWVDENAEEHDKKRRRKSYRDWKAWKYSARTPSPDREDADMEEDVIDIDVSPSRPTQLPDTPVSPPKPDLLSVAAGSLHRQEHTYAAEKRHQEATTAAVDVVEEENGDKIMQGSHMDNLVRDKEYYELYAGSGENFPEDSQFPFGGDTEANTEEDDGLEQTDCASLSATEVNTEDQEEDRFQNKEHGPTRNQSVVQDAAVAEPDAGSATEDNSLVDIVDILVNTKNTREATENISTVSAEEQSLRVEEAPAIVMPPPTIPALNTSFFAPANTSGLLTPIGREPASPILQPLDSALLPLPSPFPGEHDSNVTSYFDHISTEPQPTDPELVEEQGPPSDASYIQENSFFSSIGSSKNPALPPDHESAFTPVRFTFGMDGAGFSRPLELSSPALEEVTKNVEEQGADSNSFRKDDAVSRTSPVVSPTRAQLPGVTNIPMEQGLGDDQPGVKQTIPEVIELSSDSDPEESEESEDEEQPVTKRVMGMDDLSDEEHTRAEDTEQETSGVDALDVLLEDSGNTDFIAIPHAHTLSEEVVPNSTSQSVPISEVVDLGSPPESSDVEELAARFEDENAGHDENSKHAFSEADHLIQEQPLADWDNATAVPTSFGSYREFTNMDYAPAFSNLTANTQGRSAAHTPTPQEIENLSGAGRNSLPFMVDDIEPRTVMQDSAMHVQDNPQEGSFSMPQWESHDMEDPHPDIKLESIENGSVFQVAGLDTQAEYDASMETVMESSNKLLINVPEDGHKVGELHTIAVPATGPARNTRSKTKASVSPTKGEDSVAKRTTRSTRSMASVTPIAQPGPSPPKTRTRSTMSPSQDRMQNSPYSLRSQSKLLSPAKNTSITATASRRSPRTHDSQRSVDSIVDAGPSQVADLGPFMTSFEPSQELGASQGRYSNVSFVKDSEEESLHSEHSLLTVKYSDEGNMFTNLSDSVLPSEQDVDTEKLNPPLANAPEQRSWLGAETRSKKSESQVVSQTNGSPTQPSFSFIPQPPLSRKLRSASSTEALPSNPRITRMIRRHVYNVSSSLSHSNDEVSEETTPRASHGAQDEAHSALPGESESESDDLGSSPPAPIDIDERMRSSPPAATPTFPSANQQSIMDSNKLMTPEATQQTNMESQTSLSVVQEQNLPMTPQLTQATSAGLQSLNTSMQNGDTAIETPIKCSPVALTKSTPCRNATQTDVTSPSSSPKQHSPDNSSDNSSDKEAPKQHSPDLSSDSIESKPETPSIGLSTPLAYYPPLNSLIYFLNRSSQFHTTSNPDVLALVTSGTTPAQRATKGRKDWTTSLHITDLSSYPATTSVNIFRAYQNALPAAETGDVMLLRAFAVKSVNRHPTLVSADESSWCVWRYKKPVWGAKRVPFGELQAREEVRGPVVERGEGEWREVEKVRSWFTREVQARLEEQEAARVHTRSQDGKKEKIEELGDSKMTTRSKDAAVNGDDMA